MLTIPLIFGWLLDRWLGDPERWPHPVVWFGRVIGALERRWNRGENRKTKGALVAVGCIVGVFALTNAVLVSSVLVPYALGLPRYCGIGLYLLFSTLMVFFCLAGKTLRQEVQMTFEAADRSVEEGRRQVARIVGRDTSNLSAQEVRTAALETLAENLSDGVVAPLFWMLLLGVPGMMTYKMVNTLDSMIGYRTERYEKFGCWAAKIDDYANYIPARLTAVLIVFAEKLMRWKQTSVKWLMGFVARYGSQHASPNSGWPEAALAGVLDCQFGGGHNYFGVYFHKPFIGDYPRPLTTADMWRSLQIAMVVETMMVGLMLLVSLFPSP